LGYGLLSEEEFTVAEGLSYLCIGYKSKKQIDFEKLTKKDYHFNDLIEILNSIRKKNIKIKQDEIFSKKELISENLFEYESNYDIYPNDISKILETLTTFTFYLFMSTKCDNFFFYIV
jgi:hypothetical protein